VGISFASEGLSGVVAGLALPHQFQLLWGAAFVDPNPLDPRSRREFMYGSKRTRYRQYSQRSAVVRTGLPYSSALAAKVEGRTRCEIMKGHPPKGGRRAAELRHRATDRPPPERPFRNVSSCALPRHREAIRPAAVRSICRSLTGESGNIEFSAPARFRFLPTQGRALESAPVQHNDAARSVVCV